MYGNCEVCGQPFGTIDGMNFYNLCTHMEKERAELHKKLATYKSSTPQSCPVCKTKEIGKLGDGSYLCFVCSVHFV